MGTNLAGDHVANDNPLGLAVHHHQIEHFCARIKLDLAVPYLPRQGLIGPQQKLLAGLTAGVEGSLHQGAAEGTGVEVTGIVAGKRNPLGDTLVDNVGAQFGQAVDIGLAGTEIAPFDGVVKKAKVLSPSLR